jgi:fumarate reductase subunit C
MLREVSSGFIGTYIIILAVGLHRLAQGPEAWENFVEALLGPAGIIFSVITLLIGVYHTYTWFEVTPKAMPLIINGKRVPGAMIVGAHWAACVVASAIIWTAAIL